MTERAALLLLLPLAACSGEEQTPATATSVRAASTASAAKPGQAPAAAAAAQAAPQVPFSYNPIGKRDPFRPYLLDLKEANGQGEKRHTEETEKYELDQYRLTGLITGTAQPSAMVEDPGGRGHVLHIGSRLGKNGGRITRITDNFIVVTEEIRSPSGDRVLVPITIKLPKPELDMLQEPADG